MEPTPLRDSEERAVLTAAARAAGAQLVETRLRSIHHRPGRSRSVLHDAVLEVEERRHRVVLVTHLDVRGYPEGALVLTDGPREAAVWRFPHDPYLPGLASAVAAHRVRELLDTLGGPPGDVTLKTRAYRPTRRAVVEVQLHGPSSGRVLYMKVLSPARAGSVARRHRQLTRAALPVPTLLGVAPEQGIVALEALAGPTLGAALRAGAPVPDPAALVELSTRIAASGVDGRRDPRAFADPVRHVPLLAELLPDRAEEIAALAAAAAAIDAPLVGVHGDLHAGQLLLGTDGAVTGMLDIDGAGQGYLAHDAGNLVAHIEVLGSIDAASAPRAAAYAARVRDAYAEVVDPDDLARATAASWLGLATSAHRAQGDDWPLQVAARIDRAAALIDGR